MSRTAPPPVCDIDELRGQRVRVHFNLHTRRWSVTALAGQYKGRVIVQVDDITLHGGPDGAVEFKVSRAGWERCRRTGHRNVHAWCIGLVHDVDTGPDLHDRIRVTYNPQRAPRFEIAATGEPVRTAARVTFAKTSPQAPHGYAWI
ncbi:hypothetical protein BJF79_07285 [Actinomadura sp. CNU-125]|uniref:hypothetical protein n=1 Tax=Actinomadura sp. CNU-125 TaxID=1904961 RepID=UPI000959EB6C|nr:hypothetical protein [Actinomadura sp. CNU-125]OLT34366.1 hypothetical protein BJF79_07285 [Actinomadura sp. CNU-125]